MLVWAIVVTALLVRLPSLFHDGLWRDEAFVYFDVVAPTFREFLTRVTQAEWHPPLFFLLDVLWVKAAGVGEVALGMPAFVFSVATVPLAYLLGRDARSEGTGILAAATYALAPTAIAYSDEYIYPMAAFSFTLLTWLVMRARRAPMTFPRFAALAGGALLCVYSHYAALLFVPLLAVWALLAPHNLRRGITIAAALAVGSLPFLLWLPVFLHQRHIGLPYAGRASVEGTLAVMVVTLVEFVPAWPPPVQRALFAALLAGFIVVVRSKKLAPDVAATGALFAAMLAVLYAGGLIAERYVFLAYPLLCVFLAAIVLDLAAQLRIDSPAFRRFGTIVLAAAAALVAGGNVAFALTYPNTPKSGIRSYVAARGLDRDALYVIAPDYLAATFAYYARDSDVAFVAFARDDRPEVFRLEDYPAIWSRPGAVDAAIGRIAALAPAHRCIVLLADADAHDRAKMLYGKTWDLLRALEARYAPAGSASYPGRWESIVAYRFASGAGGRNCR